RPPDCRQSLRLIGRLNNHVATSDALFRADRVVHQEFAVHNRNAPIPPPRNLLALLIAVAKKTNLLSEWHTSLRVRQPIINGRRRTSHYALANAIGNAFDERVR